LRLECSRGTRFGLAWLLRLDTRACIVGSAVSVKKLLPSLREAELRLTKIWIKHEISLRSATWQMPPFDVAGTSKI
jgi:hypothetical protein